ncbi:PucR family transcriptional regulator [Pedococcus sp. 5OH_020]|uniref:PucR family transcriptional regulator n=1 Tax=Pedococcus sp. 5OH_020 TaxID=2989814 RepID=UPI0022E9D3FA|nr:PucR family transcriptional regulator [Pedococcus sp. 5OH_020]
MSTQPPAASATERAAGLTLAPEVLAQLKGALPAVASHAVQAIVDEVPSYAGARDYLFGNIETAVQVALGTFLRVAARSDDPSTPLGPAREASYALGRGEARSGRSMDALLSAYRIGARVSWRGIADEAVRAGMSAALLAQFAELVFAYIDELSAASVAGHADELASAERVQERQLERLALDLLRGAPEDVVLRRADRAGWDLPKTVTVLLLPDAELHHTRTSVEPRSLVLTEDVPGVGADEDLVAIVVPRLSTPARTRLVAKLEGHDVVLGPSRPWQATATSLTRALRGRAARGAAGGTYDTDVHLADIVLDADAEARADLRRRVLAPIAELTPATRERLEETLRAWLLHRGRREAVAEALFVHPQTVRYRVGQLREHFGDDLDDPVKVRDLMVALG